MKIKLQGIILQISHLPRAIRLVWNAAPRLSLVWMALLAVQGLLPAATVFLTRYLVDSLVVAMNSGGEWQKIQPTVTFAALMVIIILLTEVLQSAGEWVRTAQAEYVQDYLSTLIHEQSSTLDLAFYESPDYFDHLHRAREDASSRPLALLESSGNLLQNGATLLAMGVILLPYGIWLPVALVLSTLPALFVLLRFNLYFHRWWEHTTSDRRRSFYYDALLTHSEYAAELRLFSLGPYFRSLFGTLRHRVRSERLALSRNQGMAQLAAAALSVVVSGAAMVWIGWRALQGLATLGDLALFYQAFNRGQSVMRTVLGNIGQIYASSLFLGNLFEFLELEAQVVDPPHPVSLPPVLRKGIRFRHVSFHYPQSERTALEEFDLTIPAGQIVAIVGTNGAGKSTVVKLLCRFYDPDAGGVEWDGTDIREFSLAELRRRITVLFQMPVPYQRTAAENISLSDHASLPGSAEIEKAARGAGAHEVITRLPQGYDTQLGTWFENGTELSGGEWQRIALARAFLRQAQVVALDEPTSNMDSWAEADWLADFRTLVKGKTAIIITHRFTTAMQADIIHVMHEGRIVESGNHAELLAQGGQYAQSWQTQMQSANSLQDGNPCRQMPASGPAGAGLRFI